MRLYGQIDLGAYFGAEVRVLDGEDCLFIPLRFNQTIRNFSGHPTLLLDIVEKKKPDADGYTHLCLPHIPRAILQSVPEADYIKMTNPVGRFVVYGATEPQATQAPANTVGHETLAPRPVTDNDIPL